MIKNVIILLVILACGYGGWLLYKNHSGTPAYSYRTVPVQRGDLLATIGATGTLEPEEVVDVGAQVAGQIMSFGKDINSKDVDPRDPNKGNFVDYNTEVAKDSILANIDQSLYQADVDQSQAALDAAKANVDKAMADQKQAQAKLTQADKDWKRAQLANQTDKVLSQADLDSFESAYEVAVSAVTSAQASVALAKTSVSGADVTLRRARLNLSYCTITSPVKGVIIDRRVNIGQTVVSSLNTPSLFLIAKDLTRMQIWASVNEADIGNIRAGMTATFTVDAVAGREFKGVVGKVRLNAQTTQNVVTYTVEINVDNSDRALKPYLTTNVNFEVAKHDGVLMVPNAVLRWTPTSALQLSPEARAAASGGGRNGSAAAGEKAGPSTRRVEGALKRHGTIWVKDGAYVKPIRVKLGLTDGLNTEVSADDLKEGMEIVSSEMRPEDVSTEAKNPFMPQFGQRRPSGAGGGGGGRGG